MPKTSIIIVNYKTPELTLKLAEKLFAMYDRHDISIYIVENASPDNSFLYLAEGLGLLCAKLQKRFEIVSEGENNLRKVEAIYDYGGVFFFKSITNGGFASGNNKILRMLMSANDEDYVWLLNPDAVPSRASLKELLYFCADKTETLVGSVILNGESIQCIGGSRIIKGLGIPKGLYANRKSSDLSLYLNKEIPFDSLDFISGASMFFSIKTLKIIRLLPEEYFLYWEEADWCKQAKNRGVELRVCMTSQIQHATSASVGLRSNFQYRIDMRNSLIFASKYHPHYIPLILTLKPLVNLVAFIRKERRFSLMPLLASCQGIADWLPPHRPEIQK